MKGRKLAGYAETTAQGSLGRILVFTGARQTGKTTLARNLFPAYEYLSIYRPTDKRRLHGRGIGHIDKNGAAVYPLF
jgi:molybdopterin-guanine dinucleotide biosynthesis protein